MSEWTAERVRSVVAAARASGINVPWGKWAELGAWAELCAIADAYAARLEADAQPVDERLQCRDLADEAAMAEFRFDGAVADIARLTARVKELEAELSAIRKPFGLDMNTWCSLCEGNLASPRELTCIRGGLLKLYYMLIDETNRHEISRDTLSYERDEARAEVKRLTARVAELETAIRLAGQPAPTVETGTCSGEPPGKTECRCTPWAGRHAKDCPVAVAKRRREEGVT